MDILEGTGSTPNDAHTALHLGTLGNLSVDDQYGWGDAGGTIDLGSPIDGAAHTYGVYFDAQVVEFFVDRTLVREVTAANAAATGRSWPFASPQYLVLNVAISDGTPSTTAFPRSMYVGPINILSHQPS